MLNRRQVGNDDDDGLTEPQPLTDTNVFPEVPDGLRNAKIVHAATGRAHTLLVTEDGELYATGANSLGACGQKSLGDLWAFERVLGPLKSEKIVMAGAGLSFSVALTESGRVFAFGSPEKGQLGHGKTGEYISNSKLNFQEEPVPLEVSLFLLSLLPAHMQSAGQRAGRQKDRFDCLWTRAHACFRP